MSIKTLFQNQKYLSKVSINELTSSGIESEGYVQEYITEADRFIPQVDYTDPKQFAKFGSAEKYYIDSIQHILNDYPFDGSKKEVLEWHNSSSYIDKYIFEKEYPRFNGYVKFSPNGWGTNSGFSGMNFGNPATKEYIKIIGVMNTGSNFGDSNVYDTGSFRASNLKLDGVAGNSIEFWLKKGSMVPASTKKEVVFDLWNNKTVSHAAGSEYGRFLVYIDDDGGVATPNIKLTYVSGTVSACSDTGIGNVLCDETWNHYGICVKNSSTDLSIKTYVNGALSGSTLVAAGAIGEVTGNMVACIGSTLTQINATEAPASAIGYGKLSGSLDEFRFWKRYRNAENIGRNWFTQVNGGSNSKDGNTSLGFYYKFNEGMTQTASVDALVLDYSGRLTHGVFVGYDSSHRSLDSAIVDSEASSFEFKDPTLYSFHPEVLSLIEQKTLTGSYHDVNNSVCLYHSLPSWIIEEDEFKEGYNAKNLTQILGQYFDNLYLQISSSIGLRNINYDGMSGSNKPYPFVSRLLESRGFDTPEIFSNMSALNQLASRGEKQEFESKIYDIKNLIYQNIYNNLSYLYKTKGTMNSIRNLIRCFGIDDELIKINLYANNSTYCFDDTYKSVSVKKKCIDFNNPDRFSATVYQYTASSNSVSFPFLSSSGNNLESSGSALTIESSFVFPKKFSENSNNYFETPFITSSLFGVHSAEKNVWAQYGDTTWGDPDTHLKVYALKEKNESKNAKFVLNLAKTYSLKNGHPDSADCIGLWRMNEAAPSDAIDESITANNCVQNNNPASVLGVINTARNTNVANCYFYFQNPAPCDYCDLTQFTISTYVYYSGTPPAAGKKSIIFLSENAIGPVYNIGIYLDENEFLWVVYNTAGGGPVHRQAANILATGWHHVCFTYYTTNVPGNATRVRLYVDNVAEYSLDEAFYHSPIGCSAFALDTPLYLGGANVPIGLGLDSASSFWRGYLDEVAWYNTEKDSSWVEDRYEDAFLGDTATVNELTLTSSYFSNVYDNEKWTLSAKIKPTKYLHYDISKGAESGIGSSFDVEFYGVNTILDRVVNEFSVSSSLLGDYGTAFLTSPKRLYVGAHRTNFTGSLLASTDVKACSSRVWVDYLTNDEVKKHAIDVENFGLESPYRNITLNKNCYYGKEIPKIETLALNWDFETVTGSDVNGQFYIEDLSSGSSDVNISKSYGWFSEITKKQHTGRGDFFPTSNSEVVDVEYLFSAKQKLPETFDDDGMIQILSRDNEIFTKDSRPINFFFSVEKSMYQTISEEMINWFATIADFNNLIGMPVNRYRQEYKDLSKLRQLFFERVSNTPDVEKYIDYYKWFDSSIVKMIYQLVPASANISEHMENIIESHILERSKYLTKFPTLETKSVDPEKGIKGINELTYDWKRGHHPLNNSQRENCFHWKQREIRTDASLRSNSPGVNASRAMIHSASLSTFNRSLTSPYKFSGEEIKNIKGGMNFSKNKKSPLFIKAFLKEYGSYLDIKSNLLELKDCSDFSDLEKKKKYTTSVFNNKTNDYSDSDIVLPFGLMSSSIDSGYNQVVRNLGISGLHQDSYIDGGEIPMQGPFTEKYVGGNQYRHIEINSGSQDYISVRPEGFRLYKDSISGDVRVFNGEMNNAIEYPGKPPKANLMRDEFAKRCLNVRNIKNANYSKSYECVQTSGRKTNNKAFVVSGGFNNLTGVPSSTVYGLVDYAKPQRGRHENVFVERFSAPGGAETSGDSNGGIGLDVESAEYSVYNSYNFRNLRVRESLKTLLTRRSGQFGTDSVCGAVSADSYISSASYQKTNRNARKKIIETYYSNYTGSSYDNYFVQHSIPANDTGYYWITSSIDTNSAKYILGYATDSDQIVFASSSLSGSGKGGMYYIGNLGGFDSSSFMTSSNPYSVNIRISNMNGLSQWPSWKQIRAGETRDARYKRKNNIIEYLEPSKPKFKIVDGTRETISSIRSGIVSSYRESPVCSKNKDLEYKLTIDNDGKKESIVFNVPFANSLSTFANNALGNKLRATKTDTTMYDRLLLQYNSPEKLGNENGVQSFDYLKYEETVYPKDRYVFLKEIRNRENFTVDYWNSNRSKRHKIDGVNSQGYVVTQSVWPLDARKEFTTALSMTGSVGGEGELQNKYTTFFDTKGIDPTLPGNKITRCVRFGYFYEKFDDDRKIYVPMGDNPEDGVNAYGDINKIVDYNHGIILAGTSSEYYPVQAPNLYTIDYASATEWNKQIGNAPGASGKITLSMWVNPLSSSMSYVRSGLTSPFPPAKQTLICFGTGTYHMYLVTGSNVPGTDIIPTRMNLGFSASFGNRIAHPLEWVTKNNPITINEWHHVAITYDKTAMAADPNTAVELYVDGAIQSALWPLTALVPPAGAVAQEIEISGSILGNDWFMSGNLGNVYDQLDATPLAPPYSHSWPYEGYMSNVSIWNDKLSSVEIQEIYNNGNPSCLYFHSAQANLLHWYPLGDGIGSIKEHNSGMAGLALQAASYPLYASRLFGITSSIDAMDGGSHITSTNIMWDMVNNLHGIPTSSMSSSNCAYKYGAGAESVVYFLPSCLINNFTVVTNSGDDKNNDLYYPRYPELLYGSGQVRRYDWSNYFKVGAMYARQTEEYIGKPWPRLSVDGAVVPIDDRQIHYTGSKIFVGDTLWEMSPSSKVPMVDECSEYESDIRSLYKDFTIVPEFRISENMDYYLNEKKGDFFSDNEGMLSLNGGCLSSSSENNFYEIYSHTDLLDNFDLINSDHKDFGEISEISLKCKAALKLLPYEGFYPAQRSLQLAQLFSQSYGDYVQPYGAGSATSLTSSWRSFLTPFFAPGILYNSIKSGIAVDYPIYNELPKYIDDFKAGPGGRFVIDYSYSGSNGAMTDARNDLFFGTQAIYGTSLNALTCSSRVFRYTDLITDPYEANCKLVAFNYDGYNNFVPIHFNEPWVTIVNGLNPTSMVNNDDMVEWKTCLASPFSKRIDFEGLIQPENYLAKSVIWDANPEYSASLCHNYGDPNTNQGSLWSGEGKLNYKLAMHNFLAEVPSFFLKEGLMSSYVSKPIPPEGILISEKDADNYYAMDVVINNSKCKSLSDWYKRRTSKEFDAFNDDFLSVGENDVNSVKGVDTQMYSRDSAFGPPWVYPGTFFTGSNSIYRYHYGYEPFTPSYFNGFGLARMIFYPGKGAGLYTIDDIQNYTKVSYVRMPTNRTGSAAIYNISDLLEYQTALAIDENMIVSGSCNFLPETPWQKIDTFNPPFDVYKIHHSFKVNDLRRSFVNWMQLSASVNLYGKAKLSKVLYEKGTYEDFVPSTVDNDKNNTSNVWVIQPKWETPILNFKNVSITSPLYGSGSISKGMWHQYGQDMARDEGVYFSLGDVPNSPIDSKMRNAHQNIFDKRQENIYTEERKNAYIYVYFNDVQNLASKEIVIDGVTFEEGAVRDGWNKFSSPIEAAQSLATSINTSNSNDGTSFSSRFTNGIIPSVYRRFTASVLIPEQTPWPNSSNTVAAVKVMVKEFGKPDTRDDYIRYPNYFASGKYGNDLQATIETCPDWLLFGNEIGNNSGVDKTYANQVNFYGGYSKEYTFESLSDLLGFKKSSKRLGELASQKQIKEAIVAVPFIEKGNSKSFFKLPRRYVDIALGTIKNKENEFVGDSVIDMIRSMKNYVFPPKMDFVTNNTIDPFVMYIFEFSYDLTRQDLKDIWQNVMPEASLKLESQEKTITHKLTKGELFDGNFENVKWMIFKVKQKAKWNYYSITTDDSDDERFKFNFNIGGKESSKLSVPEYSYNWPFDFCSLIDRAKLDVGLVVENKKEEKK